MGNFTKKTTNWFFFFRCFIFLIFGKIYISIVIFLVLSAKKGSRIVLRGTFKSCGKKKKIKNKLDSQRCFSLICSLIASHNWLLTVIFPNFLFEDYFSSMYTQYSLWCGNFWIWYNSWAIQFFIGISS